MALDEDLQLYAAVGRVFGSIYFAVTQSQRTQTVCFSAPKAWDAFAVWFNFENPHTPIATHSPR